MRAILRCCNPPTQTKRARLELPYYATALPHSLAAGQARAAHFYQSLRVAGVAASGAAPRGPRPRPHPQRGDGTLGLLHYTRAPIVRCPARQHDLQTSWMRKTKRALPQAPLGPLPAVHECVEQGRAQLSSTRQVCAGGEGNGTNKTRWQWQPPTHAAKLRPRMGSTPPATKSHHRAHHYPTHQISPCAPYTHPHGITATPSPRVCRRHHQPRQPKGRDAYRALPPLPQHSLPPVTPTASLHYNYY